MLPVAVDGEEQIRVALAFTMSGTLGDYTPTVIDSMRQVFADRMRVALDTVTITVTAGSVVVAVEIIAAASASNALVTSLSAAMADPATATTFLAAVPGITLVVQSIDTPPAAVTYLPSAPSPPRSDAGAVAGAVIGVLAALGLGAVAARRYRARAHRKSSKVDDFEPSPRGEAKKDAMYEAMESATLAPLNAASATTLPATAYAAAEGKAGEAVVAALAAQQAAAPPPAAEQPDKEISPRPTGGGEEEAPAPAPSAALLAETPAVRGTRLPPIGGDESRKGEGGHKSRTVFPE